MNNANDKKATCPNCGFEYPTGAEVCPGCGTVTRSVDLVSDARSDWIRERNKLKTLWVVSVVAFWVSAVILGIIFVIHDKLDLTITSITLGMLVIGMWLKLRYQRHLRKDPEKQASDVEHH